MSLLNSDSSSINEVVSSRHTATGIWLPSNQVNNSPYNDCFSESDPCNMGDSDYMLYLGSPSAEFNTSTDSENLEMANLPISKAKNVWRKLKDVLRIDPIVYPSTAEKEIQPNEIDWVEHPSVLTNPTVLEMESKYNEDWMPTIIEGVAEDWKPARVFDGGDWNEGSPVIQQSPVDIDKNSSFQMYKQFLSSKWDGSPPKAGDMGPTLGPIWHLLEDDLSRAIQDKDLLEINRMGLLGRKFPINLKTASWLQRCEAARLRFAANKRLADKKERALEGRPVKTQAKTKAARINKSVVGKSVESLNMFSTLDYANNIDNKSGPPSGPNLPPTSGLMINPNAGYDPPPAEGKVKEPAGDYLQEYSSLFKRVDAIYMGYGAVDSKVFAPVAWESFRLPVRLEVLDSSNKSWTDKVVQWGWKDFSRTSFHSVSMPKGFLLHVMSNFWAVNGCSNDKAALLACKTFVKSNLRQVLLTPEQEFSVMAYAPALSFWLSRPALSNSDLLFLDGLVCDKSTAASIRKFLWVITFGLASSNPNIETDVLVPAGLVEDKPVPIKHVLTTNILASRPVKVEVKIRDQAGLSQIGMESDKDNTDTIQAYAVGVCDQAHKPVVFSKSPEAERIAIEKRILAKPAHEITDEDIEPFNKWVSENFEVLFNRSGIKIEPMPFDTWLKGCNASPGQKQLYLDAKVRLEQSGVDITDAVLTDEQISKYSRNKAFVKREFLLLRTHNGIKQKAPRLIQGCEAEYMVLTGPWFAAFNGYLREIWHPENFLVYASGRSSFEVATEFTKGIEGMNCGDTDQRAFDSNFQLPILKTENTIAQRHGAPKHVTQLHAAMANKRGRTGFGLSYCCCGGRSSGEGCTSCFNSMINILIHAYSFHQHVKLTNPTIQLSQLKRLCKFVACGDDNIFWHAGTKIDWEAHMSKLGFDCAPNYRGSLHAMEFCSCRLTRVQGGYAFIPKAGRILSKLGFSISANNPVEAKQFVYGSCLSIDNQVGKHPIVGPVLALTKRLTMTVKPKFDKDTPWKMGSPVPIVYTNESFLDICAQYDWSSEKQREFEENLKSSSNYQNYECPLFSQVCDIDSDGDNDVVIVDLECCEASMPQLSKSFNDMPNKYSIVSQMVAGFVDKIEHRMRRNLPGSFPTITAELGKSDLRKYGIVPLGCGPRPGPVKDLTRYGIEPKPGPTCVRPAPKKDLTMYGIEKHPGPTSGTMSSYKLTGMIYPRVDPLDTVYNSLVGLTENGSVNQFCHFFENNNAVLGTPFSGCSLIVLDNFSTKEALNPPGSFHRQIDRLVSIVSPNTEALLQLNRKAAFWPSKNMNSIAENTKHVLGKSYFFSPSKPLFANWAFGVGAVSKPYILLHGDDRIYVCVTVDLELMVHELCKALWPRDPNFYKLLRGTALDLLVPLTLLMESSNENVPMGFQAGSTIPVKAKASSWYEWDLISKAFSISFVDFWPRAARVSTFESETQIIVREPNDPRFEYRLSAPREFWRFWVDCQECKSSWIEDLTESGIEPNPGPSHSDYFFNYLYDSGCFKVGDLWNLDALSPHLTPGYNLYEIKSKYSDMSWINVVTLKVPAAGPIKDLTTEGVEPNPGPTDELNGVSPMLEREVGGLTQKIETKIKQMGGTKCGSDWCMAALDPYHDSEFSDLKGFPDGSGMASVLQVINTTATISCPSTVTAGTWEAHFTNWNSVVPTLMTTGFASTTRSAGTNNSDATAMQIYSHYNPLNINAVVGGMTVTTGATGFSDYQTGNEIALPTVLTPANAYTTGCYRVIGQAFEVRSVGPDLYKAGSSYLWRMPTASSTETVATQFNSDNTVTYNPSPANAYVYYGVPTNTSDAQLIPTTVNLMAKEGCYVVSRFNSLNPTINDNDLVAPIIRYAQSSISDSNGYLVDNAFVPRLSNTGLTTGGFTWVTGQAPACTMISNFDLSGAMFAGLNLNDVLQVRVRWIIEKFPSIDEPTLVVMARPTPLYDPIAIEAYSRMVSTLPVGTAVRNNSLGEWFRDAASTVASMAAPLLAKVPHPAAQAAAGIAKAVSSALSTGKKEIDKATKKAVVAVNAAKPGPKLNGKKTKKGK